MLDEFPALGRLDFFESALAFMAGYGVRAFLIAQSLNQIEKAYGPNNAILDNCHVRIAFATNDERTAKRISDAVGSTTEMRAMRNYAGHRLAPWLSHVMVSRQETARQLLTPGEVMQLPADEEIILLSGTAPIKANKITYYTDKNFTGRVCAPPTVDPEDKGYAGAPHPQDCLWGQQIRLVDDRLVVKREGMKDIPADAAGKDRQPKVDDKQHALKPPKAKDHEQMFDDDGNEVSSRRLDDIMKPVIAAHQIARTGDKDMEI